MVCFPVLVFSYTAADIVLDKEPWLNATTACTYCFDCSSTESSTRHQDIQVTMTPQSNVVYTKSKLKEVDQFLGQYGNFGYGNLTVVVDDILEELIINFDVFSSLS